MSRLWAALAAAGIIVGIGYAVYCQGVRDGRAEVTAQWTASQLAYDQAVRLREDEYTNAQAAAAAQRDEETKDASATIARVHADRERLRVALRDAIGRIPAENGSAASGTGSSGTVLADVCSGSGEVAAELAAYADRERIARQACQRAWPVSR